MMNAKINQEIFNDFLAGEDFYCLFEKYKVDYNLIERTVRFNLTDVNFITPMIGLEIFIEFIKGLTVSQLAEKYNINPFGVQKILRDTINNLSLADINVADIILTDFI